MADVPSKELRKKVLKAVGTEEHLKLIALLLVELVAWQEAGG